MFVTCTSFLIASLVPCQPLVLSVSGLCEFSASFQESTVPQQSRGLLRVQFFHPNSVFPAEKYSRRRTPFVNNFLTTKLFYCVTACSFLASLSNSSNPNTNTMMPIMMPFNSLFLFFLLLVVVVSDSDRCYAPNGDSVDDVASCWQTGLCCRQGDLCLNSTLCVADLLTDTPSYYRGSCLDRNWEDPTCPNFCLGAKQSDGASAVYPCTDEDTQGRWYCDGDGSMHDACGSPDDYFELSGMWSNSLSRLGSKVDIQFRQHGRVCHCWHEAWAFVCDKFSRGELNRNRGLYRRP